MLLPCTWGVWSERYDIYDSILASNGGIILMSWKAGGGDGVLWSVVAYLRRFCTAVCKVLYTTVHYCTSLTF